MTVLPLLEVNYAHVSTIHDDDKELITEDITYPGDATLPYLL